LNCRSVKNKTLAVADFIQSHNVEVNWTNFQGLCPKWCKVDAEVLLSLTITRIGRMTCLPALVLCLTRRMGFTGLVL
jgi:hypothetical protein